MWFGRTFEFDPVNGARWGISGDDPWLWWQAKFDVNHAVRLSDGRNAVECEVEVSIVVAKDTTLPSRIIYSARNEVVVALAVSAATFDRVLRGVQNSRPPRLIVGFGPDDRDGELTGPITYESPGEYRWATDEKGKSDIKIENCDFIFLRSSLEKLEEHLYAYFRPPIITSRGNLVVPKKASITVRGWRIVRRIVINLLAVLIAIAVLNAATTPFETAVVSLLLLIYIVMYNANRMLGIAVLQFDVAALIRFLQLRTLLGVATSPDEEKYLDYARGKVNEPDPRLWIDVAGNSIIGLLVLYKLVPLLL